MEPYKQRVVDELAALQDKIYKLTAFFETPMYKDVPFDEQCRLKSQFDFMSGYARCLNQRIMAFH